MNVKMEQSWRDGANIQNKNGDTALHLASACSSSTQIIKWLIEACPGSVLMMNTCGQSALDRAEANGANQDIIDLLKKSTNEFTESAQREGWGFSPNNQ